MASERVPELALLRSEAFPKLLTSARATFHGARPTGRIVLVDALRGFALLGLFLVHCVEYFELYWRHPEPSHIHNAVDFLFADKAYAVFALLFGYSFFLFINGRGRRQADVSGRFAWRLLLLVAMGYFNSLIYVSDILQVLGLLGLSLLLFNRLGNRTLLILSVMFLAHPHLLIHALISSEEGNKSQLYWMLYAKTAEVFAHGGFLDVVRLNLWQGQLFKWAYIFETARISSLAALFIWGLLLGRIGFFTEPDRFLKQRRWGILLSVMASLLLHALLNFYNAASLMQSHAAAKLSLANMLESWAALAMATAGVLLFVEAFSLGLCRRFLALFAPCGQMSLTIYVGQGLLGVTVFYGFGLGWYQDMGQGRALFFGLGAFAAMMLFAHLWMRHYRYGPLEWLWRCGTYLSFDVPLRRQLSSRRRASAV